MRTCTATQGPTHVSLALPCDLYRRGSERRGGRESQGRTRSRVRFVKAGVRLACCKVAVDGYSLSHRISELVRAGSPEPLIICDRGSPCLRLLACHLQTTGRPNGDCSSSTTSVNHRGPPSVPRAGLGIHGLNR